MDGWNEEKLTDSFANQEIEGSQESVLPAYEDPLQDIQFQQDDQAALQASSSRVDVPLPLPKSPVTTSAATKRQKVNNSVCLSEPEKHGDGMNSYITYKLQWASSAGSPVVRRRYGDFHALFGILKELYPQCVIPPLPPKQRMEYLERFSEEFIERRRIALERFLVRLLAHNVIGQSQAVQKFMTLEVFSAQATAAIAPEKNADSVNEYLVNAFAKIKKPDETFVTMLRETDSWIEGMQQLEKAQAKLTKLYDDLAVEYATFGAILKELSTDAIPLECCEPKLKQVFAASSQVPTQLAHLYGQVALEQDLNVDLLLKDQIGFGEQVKDLLKTRDSKQIDFEQMSDYLQDLRNEKIRLTTGMKTSGSSGSLANYFKDRVEELKGSSPSQIKADRLIKVEQKMSDMERAVEQANLIHVAFNKQTLDEYKRYKKECRDKETISIVKEVVSGHLALSGSGHETCARALSQIGKC